MTNLNELQLSVVELKALLETSLTLSREHAPADRVEELEAQAEASYYPQNLQDMKDMLTESLEGMRRIRDIVGDLKGFQRADEDEWMPLDINQALKTAVEMARSQMAGACKLRCHSRIVPQWNVSPGRLAQAFLNILLNGIQAYAKKSEFERCGDRLNEYRFGSCSGPCSGLGGWHSRRTAVAHLRSVFHHERTPGAFGFGAGHLSRHSSAAWWRDTGDVLSG